MRPATPLLPACYYWNMEQALAPLPSWWIGWNEPMQDLNLQEFSKTLQIELIDSY